MYQEATINVLFPYLEKALASQWEIGQLPEGDAFFHTEPSLDYKEAAILALGSICDEDGCATQIESHLANLVPYLVKELQNESDLIKSTTLWTLSKFSKWTATT